MVVVAIVVILSAVAYVGVQNARERSSNDKMLDDLIAIANALEDYRRDHNGEFPAPTPGSNQNIICYYEDATFADCDDPSIRFIQGMIDNNLLSKRYLREVPLDPRTGSRYSYGVTVDSSDASIHHKFFQVAGVYFDDAGEPRARMAGNLAKGFDLPSIIRAYDSANYVVDEGIFLPYSPDAQKISLTVDNISPGVTVGTDSLNFADNGKRYFAADINGDIVTDVTGSVDLFFSDGSESHLQPGSTLEVKNLEVEQNDKEGTVTKILLKIKAGKIWSKVVRLAQDSEFQVEMAGGIAGVKGTMFSVDGDSGVVTSYDGEVWHLTGGETGEDVEANPAIIPTTYLEELKNTLPPDQAIASYIPVGSPYYDAFTKLTLHKGIEPRILKVKDGFVDLRNVQSSLIKVDNSLGFPGSHSRQYEVDRIAAYKADQVNSADFDFTNDLARSWNIIATPPSAHNIDMNGVTEKVVFRFEKLVSGKPVFTSGFSKPIAMTASTVLDERDVYKVVKPKPQVLVQAPAVYTLPLSGTGQFVIDVKDVKQDGVRVPNPDLLIYDLDYSGSPTSNCDPRITLPTPTTSFPYSINVPALSAGQTCAMLLTVKLEDGTVLQKNIDVDIRASSSRLSLVQPPTGPAPGPPTLPVNTLAWAKNNVPGTPGFSVSYSGPMSNTFPCQSATSINLPTALALPGDYTWTVSMYQASDCSGPLLEPAKTGNFKVVAISDPTVAEFKVMKGANVILDVDDFNPVPLPFGSALNLDLRVPGANTAAYDYLWNVPSIFSSVTPSLADPNPSIAVPDTSIITNPVMARFELRLTDRNSGVQLPPISKSVLLEPIGIQSIVFNPSSMSVTANGTSSLLTAKILDVTLTDTTVVSIPAGVLCSAFNPASGSIEAGPVYRAPVNPGTDTIGCSIAANTPVGPVNTTGSEPAATLSVSITSISLASICTGPGTYYDTGLDECWVLSAPAEACSDPDGAGPKTGACDRLDGSIVGQGVECATGDWNDPSCNNCNLIGGTSCISFPDTSAFAPLYTDQCSFRSNTTSQDCFAEPNIPAALGGPGQRVCKCI